MKKTERIYKCCGKVSLTFSRAKTCTECKAKERYAESRKTMKDRLEKLYDEVTEGERTHYGRITWTFIHRDCGTRQTWTSTNLHKRFEEDPSNVPCSHCGSKRRTTNATKAYIAKYGMSPERLKEWEGYRNLVRRLSDATYRKFKAEINPHNHPRGVKTYHLDHKFPIIEGFIQGADPMILADKSNLQMLPSSQNISKGRSFS